MHHEFMQEQHIFSHTSGLQNEENHFIAIPLTPIIILKVYLASVHDQRCQKLQICRAIRKNTHLRRSRADI